MKERIIVNLFKKYYSKTFPNEVVPPKDLEKREFAYIPLDKKTMIRHISFRTLDELTEHLANNTPAHVYYSSAYYLQPYVDNMDEKGWLGADLIFDIDADHLDTPCKEEHDYWWCTNCEERGTGPAPAKCPLCGGEVKSKSWICEKCLDAAKAEVEKLVEILVDDFGFTERDIKVFFSGHRGFHIHVENEKVLKLSQDARREIVDYVEGIGFKAEFFVKVGKKHVHSNLKLTAPGWYGRLTKALYEFIETLSKENAPPFLSEEAVNYLTSNREKILKDLAQPSPSLEFLREIGPKATENLLQHLVKKAAAHIDERVTIDIKRLIRLPGSLHGKTGLKVTEVDLNHLWDFNPFEHARVFPDYLVKVKIEEKIPKKIFGYTIKIKHSIATVPLYLACYIVGNEAGTLC